MGDIQIIEDKIIISSHFIYYGDSADEEVCKNMSEEIDEMWNSANGVVYINDRIFSLKFNISFEIKKDITDIEILQNTNPKNNYIRIEDYSPINISWVDGIGSNTGYFLYENLYNGSTTAAHEYGHSIGLVHPENLVIIGTPIVGIMYPRGTIVNPEFQYVLTATPGQKGGTLNPIHRRVTQNDINNLNIASLIENNKNYIGNFSSKYHSRILPPVVS